MSFSDSRDEIIHSKLLFIILGILLVPVVNSIDDLLMGVYRLLGLSIKSLLISSIGFHGLIIGMLTIVMVYILRNSKIEPKLHDGLFKLKTFRIGGVAFLLVILGGGIANIYNGKYLGKMDLSKVDSGGLEMTDILNLTLVQTGLRILSGILIFSIYFVITFSRRSREMHCREQVYKS
jgi:hypothetical protein